MPSADGGIAAGKTVELFYATNRRAAIPVSSSNPFTSASSDKLSYGIARVFVPKSRVRGSLGVPNSRTNPPILFKGSLVLEEDFFWRSALSRLREEAGSNVTLVFIHGYNNSFQDAARRTAQIWTDLELEGLPMFFSWPSRSSTPLYTRDEATMDASEAFLEKFLIDLRKKVGEEKPIHIIAHSMGNRALLRISRNLQDKVKFGQIFLAAPDVGVQTFNNLAQAYKRISNRTTIYVSRSDKAVGFSQFIHGENRVGFPPDFVKFDGIDTVEVEAKTGLLQLGHSYFAEFNPVLDDMMGLIANNPDSSILFPGRRTNRLTDCLATAGALGTRISCNILRQP